jgi:hypothetical protein
VLNCKSFLVTEAERKHVRLKNQMKGHHFLSDTEVIAAAETWLDGQPSEFFMSGVQKLEQRARKSIELCEEYVEQLPSLVTVACFLPGQAKDLSAPLIQYAPRISYFPL